MECPICGASNATESLIDYRMLELGTDSVLLRNTPETTCPDCGESAIAIPKYKAVLKQIREQLCALNRVLNDGEFLTLRHALGLSGQECASIMGVTNVTVSRWENGKTPILPIADRLMRSLTLSGLGYTQKAIIARLSDLENKGVSEITIDLSSFSGTTYKHETCVRFGSDNSDVGEPLVMVFVNPEYADVA